jgi:hypothetical protein
MANTPYTGNDVKLYLYHTTYTSAEWKELVCSTALSLSLAFNEVTAASKCGTTVLSGSEDFSIDAEWFALADAATTGTISSKELMDGILAQATWDAVIADAYSGATKFRVTCQGQFTNVDHNFDADTAVTGSGTFRISGGTLTWDL